MQHKPESEALSRTLKVWQPRAARQLSLEDAREIAENFVRFFQVLASWEEAITAPTGASAEANRICRGSRDG